MTKHRGEFLFTKELRQQVDIPRPHLLELGRAGLLFMQRQVPVECEVRPIAPTVRKLLPRYHLPYTAGALEAAGPDWHDTPQELREMQFTDYAASNTEVMSEAMIAITMESLMRQLARTVRATAVRFYTAPKRATQLA